MRRLAPNRFSHCSLVLVRQPRRGCLRFLRRAHRSLPVLLLAAALLFGSGLGSVITAAAAHAASPAACAAGGNLKPAAGGDCTPAAEAQSMSYDAALTGCVGNVMYGDFDTTVAENGASPPTEWFNTGTGTLGGATRDHYGYTYPGGTKTECSDIAASALALWGWGGDYQGFLTAMGYSYHANTSTGKPSYNSPFGGVGENKDREAAFQKAVQQKVYGGNAPVLSAAAQYDLASDAFLRNGGNCQATDLGLYGSLNATEKQYVDAGTVQDAATNSSGIGFSESGSMKYDKVIVVDPDDGSEPVHGYAFMITSTTYSQGGSLTDSITETLYGYPPTTNEACATLVSDMNKDAAALSAWLKANADTPDRANDTSASSETATQDCSSTVQGLGWIVCSALNALGGLDDAMWGFVSGLMTQSPFATTDLVQQAWRVFQSIANVLLVIAFLVIIFVQLTGFASSSVGANLGVKKALPRLIIVAILGNLSFSLMEVAVDVVSIVGNGLYQLLNGIASNPTVPSWTAQIGAGFGLLAGGAAVGTALAISPEWAFYLALPAAAAAALGFLAAVVTLFLRQALIPILAMLAPIALVAYIFPNTKPWFDRWWKLLVPLLVLYPLAAVLFGGLKLSAAIINSGGQWWTTLAALIVMGAPLFMLPFLARQSGPALGKIAGGISNLSKRISQPVAKWAGAQRKQALDISSGRPAGRFNLAKRAYQGIGALNKDRAIRAQAGVEEAKARDNQRLTKPGAVERLSRGLPKDGAGANLIRAGVTRAQAEEVKNAMDAIRADKSINTNNREHLQKALETSIASDKPDYARVSALTNFLAQTRGADELAETIGNAQKRPGGLSEEMAATLQGAVTSPENGGILKERRPDLVAWGGNGGDLAVETNNAKNWNKSAEEATGWTIKGFEAAKNSGGLTQEAARQLLSTDSLRGKIDPDKQKVVIEIAGGDPKAPTGGAAPSSPSGGGAGTPPRAGGGAPGGSPPPPRGGGSTPTAPRAAADGEEFDVRDTASTTRRGPGRSSATTSPTAAPVFNLRPGSTPSLDPDNTVEVPMPDGSTRLVDVRQPNAVTDAAFAAADAARGSAGSTPFAVSSDGTVEPNSARGRAEAAQTIAAEGTAGDTAFRVDHEGEASPVRDAGQTGNATDELGRQTPTGADDDYHDRLSN